VTLTSVSTRCRVCGEQLDAASLDAGRGVHVADLTDLDLTNTPDGAQAIIARQRAACAAGRQSATAPAGVWLDAGTSTAAPYPCRCADYDDWQHQHNRCACQGRTDTANLPETCCAYVAPVEPVSTVDELRAVLIDYELARPRTMQVALGPSELGTHCLAQMARKIAGLPQRELTSPNWAPLQGVAVHAEMEKVVAHWNAVIGRERWIAEDELQVSPEIVGHGDAFDVDNAMVVDWKHVGTTALKKLHSAQRAGKPPAEQVSQEYRVQAHLYGLGHAAKGRHVQWVRLVLLARSWDYDDSAEWTEAYNPQIAQWALERYRETAGMVDALDIATYPSRINALPIAPGECAWCPFYRPGGANDALGCPGDVHAHAAARERFSAGLVS